MGRDLTPEERSEFEKQRQENLKKVSALMGLPVDTILEIERKGREELKAEAAADTMTDEEFAVFVDEQCSRFSEEHTKSEFRRIAADKRNNYDDEIFSLREALTRTANNMLKSEQY